MTVSSTDAADRRRSRADKKLARHAEKVARQAEKLATHAEKHAARAAAAQLAQGGATASESGTDEHVSRSAARAAKRAARSEARTAQRARREAARASRPERPARARTAERARAPGKPADVKAQLKLWLGAIDALLKAVENTAWQARKLGDSVLSAFQGGVAKSGDEPAGIAQARTLRNELSEWPKKLSRLSSTGLVLGRIGASYRFHSTKAAFMSRESAEAAWQALHDDSARRLYALSIKHGGAFLKLGQMLSSRPDLLPEAYVRELGKLQDAAPAVAYEVISACVERELGRPLSEVFSSFDEQPVASASIGQVHRATLLDGRKVAVKVQRPNIAELVALDMELLEVFVRALAESLPPLDFDTIIRETRAMVSAELDYCREAALTAQLSSYFADHQNIHVPAVVSELSTSRMLVTVFMQGEKITNVLDRLQTARDSGEPEAQRKLSDLLSHVLEAYARQVLEVGVFQADPHPGNLLADDAGNLTVLDFGCAKELDHGRRAILLSLLKSTVMRDTDGMADAMVSMGFKTRSGTREGLRALADSALSQMALVKGGASDFVSQLEMVGRIAEFGRHIDSDPILSLPEEFVMLGRVFGTLSGLFVHYQPDVSATSRVLPVLFGALMQLQAPAQAAA
ncbi:MAG: transporter [Myxococcaceae bacterium]|nr:transporter [Myxococcaceae bacterium]